MHPYNIPLDRGRSNFDIRHRFVTSLVWKPAYSDHSAAAVRRALSGWTIAAVFTAQTGLPYTAAVTGNPASGLGASGSGDLGAQSSTNRVPFLERNSSRYPGINDTDLRISRAFCVSEHTNQQFIAEAFNFGNHVNYTSAITTAYTVGGTAGVPVFNPRANFRNAHRRE